MPTALEVAQDQAAQQRQLVRATAAAGVQMWQQINVTDLAGSWSRHLSRLLVILRGAQVAAAGSADSFTDSALLAQGLDVAPAGRVAATAFSGTASDGRPLESLLQNPVFATKAAILKGADMPRALATGQASLEMLLRTQVADAGRVAAGVAITARTKTGYTRLLVGESCPRCVILAGRFYRYSTGFLRHPQDDCIMVPSESEESAQAEDLISDPQAHFNALSESEQDKTFGRAGAQAIRDGADMNQVVNARSGMYTAGGTLLTRTGTTRRALAGARLGKGKKRLMPEAIYQLASDRDEAIRLLMQHGYLI